MTATVTSVWSDGKSFVTLLPRWRLHVDATTRKWIVLYVCWRVILNNAPAMQHLIKKLEIFSLNSLIDCVELSVWNGWVKLC